MSLFADLQFRGLVHQATDADKLAEWLAAAPRTLYAGFDPTADSLHIGHLVALTTLRRFQRAGHRPIALVGGATGMIGDPSGQSKERNLLSPETLAANVAGMRGQIARFLDFEGPRGALLVNNFDWMQGYSYLAFLRDVGKCFPVNVMTAKDSVKARLESPSGLSYTEFSYMLLQAYDFVHLHQAHGCELQIGGSDQWGNITAGIELARRLHSAHLQGMTTPLLLDSEGKKMGKTSEGKTVWLAAERTSPYAFYQYWLNVADADVENCLKFFTDLSADEITALAASRAADAGKRESQKRLAEEMTRLIHGEAGFAKAQKATATVFGAEIENWTDAELGEIFADMPSKTLPRARLDGEGLSIVDALVESGLAGSKGDAKRTVEQGGAYVSNRRVDGLTTKLTAAHLASETVMVLRSGKKKYALLRFA